MSDSTESASGFFALVCYVPDPVKAQVEILQSGLVERPIAPVHITILPPRPLRCDVTFACQAATESARDFAPFEVELSAVRCFHETAFLYIDIEAGSGLLRELHARLNTGVLKHSERHEYWPHVTLAGPLDEGRLTECQGKTAEAWLKTKRERRVEVRELVCLWLAYGTEEWVRVSSFSLSAAFQESKILS